MTEESNWEASITRYVHSKSTMTAPPPVANALQVIGNTPVVHLRRLVPENHADVYLKLESVNPTGSYKVRMAKSMIEEAERRGDLKPGMTVVEATGGSTGSSLAYICVIKGYRFRVVSSTGLNVAAALAMAKELGPGKTVVTVAVDTGLKYLNGNLFSV